ncbi:MAG: hypothetical protein AAGE98_00865 [Actinomycetota bacterium]
MRNRAALVGSAAWVGSRVLAQGLEFLAWVLLARGLGADSVGRLAVAAITARLLGLVADWGAAFRGPRDVVQNGRDADIVVALVRRREQVAAILAVAMALGTFAFGHMELAPIALVVLARGAGRDWIALGEGRRLAAAVPLLVQSTVLVAVVLATGSVSAAAIGLGVANLLGLVCGLVLNPVHARRPATSIVVDGWYLMASISDQILVSSDTVLLVVLQSATEAGVYTSVYRLPLAWLTVVGLVTTAAIPLVSRAVADGRADERSLHGRADVVAVAGALFVLPAAILGLVLVGPLFGSDFETGRDALLILFIATAATTASAPYRILYTSFAPDRPMAVVTAAAAAGNLLANLVVIGPFGMEGAAMTTLLSQLGMLAFFVRWSMRQRTALPVAPATV